MSGSKIQHSKLKIQNYKLCVLCSKKQRQSAFTFLKKQTHFHFRINHRKQLKQKEINTLVDTWYTDKQTQFKPNLLPTYNWAE